MKRKRKGFKRSPELKKKSPSVSKNIEDSHLNLEVSTINGENEESRTSMFDFQPHDQILSNKTQLDKELNFSK